MENNGLNLQQVKSTTKPLDVIDNLEDTLSKNIPQKSFVVAYLHNEVLTGTCENGEFNLYGNKNIEAKFIQKLRVFNNTKELFIWHSSDGLKGRLRDDQDGEDVYVIDAQQVLYGTDWINLTNSFSKIIEARGTEIILPFAKLDVKDKTKDKRVFIKTRNYIDYNEAYQATYVDCRFVGFMNNNKELS